jgi:hypothetical protein
MASFFEQRDEISVRKKKVGDERSRPKTTVYESCDTEIPDGSVAAKDMNGLDLCSTYPDPDESGIY